MTAEPVPAGTTLIIRGGRAILPDADWHAPPEVDIAIAGGEIAGIAPSFAPLAGASIDVLDARGHLVLPGFVNAHYHSHDVLAKGTLEEVPLESWRLYALPPQYPPRSVEEVRARTLLGGLECLRSGITTIQDMLTLYPFEDRHLDAVMQAYEQVGIRVIFSLQYADRRGLQQFPTGRRCFRRSCMRSFPARQSRNGSSTSSAISKCDVCKCRDARGCIGRSVRRRRSAAPLR